MHRSAWKGYSRKLVCSEVHGSSHKTASAALTYTVAYGKPAPHVVVRMDIHPYEYRRGASNLCFSSPINHIREDSIVPGAETALLSG